MLKETTPDESTVEKKTTKEPLLKWSSYVFWVVLIVFAGGGWVNTIVTNTAAIADVKKDSKDADKELKAADKNLLVRVGDVGNELKKANKELLAKVENTEDDIVALRLQYKDIEGLAENTYNVLRDIKATQTITSNAQQKMVTDVEVIKVKVNNLINNGD